MYEFNLHACLWNVGVDLESGGLRIDIACW